MTEDEAALVRMRILRRDGYRCQDYGCTTPTSRVGLPVGVDPDQINLVALCSFHVEHPGQRKPRAR